MYGFGFSTILFSCAMCWVFIATNDQMITTVAASTEGKTHKLKVSSQCIVCGLQGPTAE